MSDLIEEVPLDSENNEESNINNQEIEENNIDNQEIEEAPAPKRSKGRPAGEEAPRRSTGGS